jgi:hypothetical protein
MKRKGYTPAPKNSPRVYYWRSFKRRFVGLWRDIKGMITNEVQR